MAERTPPTRIKQNRPINALVEALARWHLKADVQGIENIQLVKELLDQGCAVETWANHLGNLDGPFIPTEFKNFIPEFRKIFVPVVGEVLWRHRGTRLLIHAYDGILMPSIR